MTPFDRFLLQADSFIIIMALIVYLFKALNSSARRRDNGINKDTQDTKPSNELAAGIVQTPQKIQPKTGHTSGEAQTIGVEDDEVACAIIAAVSTASKIPLSSIKIKSIKVMEK